MWARDRQQEDPDSMLRLATQAIALRRRLWDNGVFTADDGGTWHVKEGNMLLCERNRGFLVAVAMGTKPGSCPPAWYFSALSRWRRTAGSSLTTRCGSAGTCSTATSSKPGGTTWCRRLSFGLCRPTLCAAGCGWPPATRQ
jgi:hypothetical protein